MYSDSSGDPAEQRSLLLVSCLQFGMHTDTYKYCEHLRHRFRVTYLGLDQGLPRRHLDGVEVVLCNRRPLGKVEFGLFLDTLRLIRSRSFDVVFLRRTKFCFLLNLLCPRVPMVFDIRSGSIEAGALRRFVEDGLTWFNSLFFRHVTVISRGLAERLKLPRKTHLLPLGADRSPTLTRRKKGPLRIIYVGTFKNRRIEVTIRGLRRFLDASTDTPCRYTIIGFGPEPDIDRVRAAVEDCGLEDVVSIRERIEHERLTEVLAENDVGIAFTPQVPWYEFQPSTKVFEYLGSGLLCIATDNTANSEIIGPENGVLVDDTEEGVSAGLAWAVARLPGSDPSLVADTIRDHSWTHIVEDNLLPYLERVMS